MTEKHCRECGAALIEKELKNEGIVPFCPKCGEFRFPMYNVAVSMIVVNRQTNQILLIQQYGKTSYVLVAGYVNRTESLENAVAREIKEETGMTVSEIRFNRTRFFERSNTLMCNFTAFVENDAEFQTNEEIDSFAWFDYNEARRNIRPNSLAAYFLNTFLDEWS
jgi:NAD+ diphosphatase